MKKAKQEEENIKNQTEEIVMESEENQENEPKNETPIFDEIQTEAHKLELEIAEAKDKYIRLYSEFENFRRRTAKEKIETITNATEGLIKELLPVLDDFERAKKSMENSDDVAAIKEGIDLIYSKLFKTLTMKGLKAMESKGQSFDVEMHECITQFAAGDDQKGLVIDEVEKGYYLNDKVIRYAKVVVGN